MLGKRSRVSADVGLELAETPKSTRGRRSAAAYRTINHCDLRRRWGVRRFDTCGDSWSMAKAACTDQAKLEDIDVPHTGCCKGYSLAMLLRPEFDGQRSWPRCTLDKYVRIWRRIIAQALTKEEFDLLRSTGCVNRSDWRKAVSLNHARSIVALSYDAAKPLGHSMSPVWLEEWETSVICRHESILVLEIHAQVKSGRHQRPSYVQVVLPAPNHVISATDTVVVVRRIACHYRLVWVNNRPRNAVSDMPQPFQQLFRLGEEQVRGPWRWAAERVRGACGNNNEGAY